MLIKIEAIVREEAFEDVKTALNEIEVRGLTVYQVMGCGIQKLEKAKAPEQKCLRFPEKLSTQD